MINLLMWALLAAGLLFVVLALRAARPTPRVGVLFGLLSGLCWGFFAGWESGKNWVLDVLKEGGL